MTAANLKKWKPSAEKQQDDCEKSQLHCIKGLQLETKPLFF